MTGALPYVLIAVLIVFSAFFSGSEIAYASLSEPYIHRLERDARNLRERMAVRLYRGYDNVLVTILVGNNLVNIGSSSVATVIAVNLMGEDGAWVATAVMTVLILTLGEIIPKILATRFCKQFAALVSVPLRGLELVTFPVVWCVGKLVQLASHLWKAQADSGPAVTEDDLETIIETVEDEGVVDEETADLLQSALDFGDVLAWEILTPRVDLFALNLDMPEPVLTAALLNTNHSRIPVYRGTVDNITGILQLDRFLRQRAQNPDAPLSDAILPARFLHKTTPISDALKLMQKERCHMVIVTDEYGGTMGALTLEDVLEQLVGDIWDESDEVHEEFRTLEENRYEADGDMRLQDFFDELDMEDEEIQEDDNATLGGWVIQKLGGYPSLGDTLQWRNLTITVKKLQKHRVLSLLVQVEPSPAEEPE